MGNRYIFDRDFNLRKVTHSIWEVLWTCVKWVIATASLASFCYLIFSFVISTDEEKRLRRENKMYEKLYPEMKEKAALLGDVVKDLQYRDASIYRRIFNANAPSVDPQNTDLFVFASDSVADKDIVEYADKKAESLLRIVDSVNVNLGGIISSAKDVSGRFPPMKVPIDGLKYAQVGASIGLKLNPFYKVQTQHNGIDLIVGQGTAVLASGDGVVKDVRRSGKGLGNVVEIEHEGGYVSVYAHLDEMNVRKGETVKTGRKVGTVGVSGNSFAPHLHYEVHRDSLVLDPVNFFFASYSPDEYMKVAYMAATTGQSMD